MGRPSILDTVTWGVRILLALAFGAAGLAKFAGVEMMVQTFEQIGIGQWFRYVTAFLELTCAVLLLVPRTAWFAALLLTGTMLVAMAMHLFLIGGSAVPALILGVLCAFVVYRLRPRPADSRRGLHAQAAEHSYRP